LDFPAFVVGDDCQDIIDNNEADNEAVALVCSAFVGMCYFGSVLKITNPQ